MTDSKKRKLEGVIRITPGHSAREERPSESILEKARGLVLAIQEVPSPLDNIPAVKKHLRHILDVCKLDENLDHAAQAGVIETVVSLLQNLHKGSIEVAEQQPCTPGVEELERDICFIMGLMAIKSEYQTTICNANALPILVAIIKRYSARKDRELSGASAQTCRRAADAITNLAHENNAIKTRVRFEGGIPPLVSLLKTIDPKVQRAVAGTLRTLAFKNEENKDMIVEEKALPLLIQMLHSSDSSIHYEAVGVIGNLVHSSQHIKLRVLKEGALQAVINLLSSSCPDSQREAALLLGQFATAESDHPQPYKNRIVQRGAVGPLIAMLGSPDSQLQEMAAFALGRLAQQADNQAGIMAMGALPKLLDLLQSSQHNLQHNAAFALYGLSENEDNLIHFVRDGALQTIHAAELGPQASRDCIQKMNKRLQEKLTGRILGQVLYIMQGGGETKRLVCTALGMLCSKEYPKLDELYDIIVTRQAVDTLMEYVCNADLPPAAQKESAMAMYNLAEACGTADDIQITPPSIAPAEPGNVILGKSYVNNKEASDVTFIVEGKPYYAHKLALLRASEIFRSMLDGNFREAQGGTSIPIPNISWEVFDTMMACIYTHGDIVVQPEMAQDLLAASDQYMLDKLKRLCEATIAGQLSGENVHAVFSLAETFNAPELAKRCALYCLKNYDEVASSNSDGFEEGRKEAGSVSLSESAVFAKTMQRMGPGLKAAMVEDITRLAESENHQQMGRSQGARPMEDGDDEIMFD